MDTNQRGAFFVAQSGEAHDCARYKGDHKNSIASSISLQSLGCVIPQLGIYCTSKAAVVQMTKAMAVEWGKFGINVNTICPGYIETEINSEHFQTEQGKRLIDVLPRKRVGTPEGLDGFAIAVGCRKSPRFINGSIIAADDGLM